MKKAIEGKTKSGKIARKVKTFLNDDGPRLKGQGAHEVHIIDTPEYQAQIERVYELLKDGMSTDEIYAILLVENNDMTESKFKMILSYSFKFGENESLKDRENAWQVHMARYENIYEKAMQMTSYYRNIPLDKTNPKDIEQIRVKAQQAMNALKYKEELIGLHDKKVIIEFNDNEATLIDNTGLGSMNGIPGYNLDNLSLTEKIELLALIKEARISPPVGIQAVVIKQRKIEIDLTSGNRQVIEEQKRIDKLNVQDITYEEMPPDVVSKFKNTRDIEPEPEIDPLILDSRPKELPPNKSAQDTKDSIQNKVLDKLREQLKDKNERKKNKKA